MKVFKPYLSLSKTIESYLLEVVLAVSKNYSIEKIEQQEIEVADALYWGVIISVSTRTQLVNGPELPVLSSVVAIDLDKSETYSKIKCIVEQILPEGDLGHAQNAESDLNFDDAQ
ncbi:hypothetical protein ACUNWD_01605 [Sunxiuqinia sp. A32]|uniref:hypothetical protein n=1 Tax=Sunxiuqinia sp. A32 TaxID=3461496 RepID=UPI004045A952